MQSFVSFQRQMVMNFLGQESTHMHSKGLVVGLLKTHSPHWDKKDPVSEHNSQLWNSGSDANKEIARKQKRRLSYYSNIYVIADPANPENEGKVFLYKYGKKIFDKIQEAMKPEFADETAINPFDFWGGAKFQVKDS